MTAGTRRKGYELAIPGFQQFMLPTLRALRDGRARHWRAVLDHVVDELDIGGQDLQKDLANGRTIAEDRTLWSLTHLYQAGLLFRVARGTYEISPDGAVVLEEEPARVDIKFLMRYPSYQAFRAPAQKSLTQVDETSGRVVGAELSDEDGAEEEFDGLGTGVEREVGDDGTIKKPWNPESIRVSTKSFSLKNVTDMIDSGDLELAPDFQRNKVWKGGQKSRLIESILLQIPLPAFYFAEDAEGMLRVVDGLQRLSTVHDFVIGKTFRLRELEYLTDLEGETVDGLAPGLRRRLSNTQIVVHVIDPTTPAGVKYDIFKRINTGGDPLNSMEIRHCMSKPRSREFLKRLAHDSDFLRATDNTLLDHVRMNDREAVLRFAAFYLLEDLAEYDSFGSLENLLNWANDQLDDPRVVDDEMLARIASDFSRAMKNAYSIFGNHAFRKWPTGEDRLMPINRALFESWSIALCRVEADVVRRSAKDLAARAREAMRSDLTYISSVSSSTSDPRRVRERFTLPARLVVEATRAA